MSDHSLFNDVTSGVNNFCSSPYSPYLVQYCPSGFEATSGFDPITGLGSINYKNLIKVLAPSNCAPTKKPIYKYPSGKPIYKYPSKKPISPSKPTNHNHLNAGNDVTNNASQAGSGLSSGAYAGIALGSFMIIVLTLFAYYYWSMKKSLVNKETINVVDLNIT